MGKGENISTREARLAATFRHAVISKSTVTADLSFFLVKHGFVVTKWLSLIHQSAGFHTIRQVPKFVAQKHRICETSSRNKQALSNCIYCVLA